MKCICCHNTTHVEFQNLDHFSGEKFSVHVCSGCGLGQTVLPEKFNVIDYYPKAYYGASSRRFNPGVEILVGIFRKLRAKEVRRWTGLLKGNILDVGCGRGIMLSTLEKLGWRVEGVELSRQSSEFARTQLNLKIVDRVEEVEQGPYDAVTLWHVLEHLESPSDMLSKIYDRLVPGGVLIVEVPQFSSWQAQIDPKSWIYLETPRHIFHFSKSSLRRMVSEHHFEIVSTSTHSIEYGYFGMLQALLNQITPKDNFLFYLLRNASGAISENKTFYWWISLGVTTLAIAPVGFLALILESIASLFGKGGCMRMVLRKSMPV